MDPDSTLVRVALDLPLFLEFDYFCPGANRADIGQRVRVSLGRRTLIGIITDLPARSDLPAEQVKRVEAVLREHPPLPAVILRLARFAADYYQAPLGAVLGDTLPPALRRRESHAETARAFRITPLGVAQLEQAAGAKSLPARATAQRRVLALLADGEARTANTLAAHIRNVHAALRALIDKGLVESVAPSSPPSGTPTAEPRLTEEQKAALEQFRKGTGYRCVLLFGVTGSGKSEVYLRLVEETLRSGAKALVLLPEIKLTPQIEWLFRARFPHATIVTLHSGLASGERSRNWLAAACGGADIVLGTRLSVFTPLPGLKLIIVDEEHDASYKQQDGTRYNARDLAVARARIESIPVVLGSATPQLETWRNAQSGRYQLLTLSQRAVPDSALPEVRCLRLGNRRPPDGLLPELLEAVTQRLARGEQSLIFINRRGFAPALHCVECGYTVSCDRCSAHLVLHHADGGKTLLCHHCGLARPVAAACPQCASPHLIALGEGTQRVESALNAHFPEARILRVDSDSTRGKSAWPEMRDRIATGGTDILVATQMLSKGHDFPGITLVGVLGADAALFSPDFRAEERLFAQLMQVAGRAGRGGRPGEVLIQTRFPEHPLFTSLSCHDYRGFAERMLAEREQAGFPPFNHQALLRAESPRMEVTLDFLARARAAALALARRVNVFDPVPAVMPRHTGKERGQLLVQSASRKALHDFLPTWRHALDDLRDRRARWVLDVDPLEF